MKFDLPQRFIQASFVPENSSLISRVFFFRSGGCECQHYLCSACLYCFIYIYLRYRPDPLFVFRMSLLFYIYLRYRPDPLFVFRMSLLFYIYISKVSTRSTICVPHVSTVLYISKVSTRSTI